MKVRPHPTHSCCKSCNSIARLALRKVVVDKVERPEAFCDVSRNLFSAITVNRVDVQKLSTKTVNEAYLSAMPLPRHINCTHCLALNKSNKNLRIQNNKAYIIKHSTVALLDGRSIVHALRLLKKTDSTCLVLVGDVEFFVTPCPAPCQVGSVRP